MKIYIRGDASETSKTTFYKVTLDDVLDYYKGRNAWMYAAFKNNGFDCLQIEDMYGSKIIDGVLYLCVTNGVDIDVNGEKVDPEEAIEKYSLDDLADYIKDVTDKIIDRKIDYYTVKDFDKADNFTEWAKELLKDYSFEDLVADYEEITK